MRTLLFTLLLLVGRDFQIIAVMLGNAQTTNAYYGDVCGLEGQPKCPPKDAPCRNTQVGCPVPAFHAMIDTKPPRKSTCTECDINSGPGSPTPLLSSCSVKDGACWDAKTAAEWGGAGSIVPDDGKPINGKEFDVNPQSMDCPKGCGPGGPVVPPSSMIDTEPEPEPMDVPAIKVTQKIDNSGCDHREYKDPKSYDYDAYSGMPRRLICGNGYCQDACVTSDENTVSRWTCADKSRVLLTDEAGVRHCIKFPKD